MKLLILMGLILAGGSVSLAATAIVSQHQTVALENIVMTRIVSVGPCRLDTYPNNFDDPYEIAFPFTRLEEGQSWIQSGGMKLPTSVILFKRLTQQIYRETIQPRSGFGINRPERESVCNQRRLEYYRQKHLAEKHFHVVKLPVDEAEVANPNTEQP